jgi:hypothetical protein
MNRDELFASIVAARPDRDDMVYLERRGQDYAWRIVPVDGMPVTAAPDGSAAPDGPVAPDVWMSFSVAWPVDEPDRMRAFFDDLLAELESMADPADRCRWPIDEPWPHFH